MINQIMKFDTPAVALEWATIASKTLFVPKEFFNRPEDVLLAIAYGAELGLPPLQSLQGICVINGKPSLYGDLMLAVCKGSHICEYIEEIFNDDADNPSYTCKAKRKDHPLVVQTYSKADAVRAGLWNVKDNWKKYPYRMLQMRARSFALRDAFPNILKGLIAREEAEDWPPLQRVSSEQPSQLPEIQPAHMTALYTQMIELIRLKNIPDHKLSEWCQRNNVLYAWDLPPESMQKIIDYLQPMETINNV